MRNIKLLLSWAVLCLIGSCNQGGKNDASESKDISVSEILPVSSSAATLQNDSTQQFTKTADLKFKVKNVISSTY